MVAFVTGRAHVKTVVDIYEATVTVHVDDVLGAFAVEGDMCVRSNPRAASRGIGTGFHEKRTGGFSTDHPRQTVPTEPQLQKSPSKEDPIHHSPHV